MLLLGLWCLVSVLRVALERPVMRSKRGCIWPFLWLNIRCTPLLILLSGYTVMTYREAAALGVKVGMKGAEALELMR